MLQLPALPPQPAVASPRSSKQTWPLLPLGIGASPEVCTMEDTLSGETTHPAKLTLLIVAGALLSVANLILVMEKS